MKKLFYILFLLLISRYSNSQPANSPYPVIFVHGINSSDQTWNTLFNYLQNSWFIGPNKTFHAVLNARGGDTTDYLSDVIIPVKDINNITVNQLSNSNIYAVNFQNFWNRDGSDPKVILYSDGTPGSNQSTSNESAIFKQAYALKKCIETVLNVTKSEKVILFGHSMGGLVIREYLQRSSGGVKTWWVDPNDNTNGHKVVKAVTFGTPHLGSNAGLAALLGIDPNSEGVRDNRYSFTGVPNAPFLFGNSETSIPTNYYNKDVDCNGNQNDIIIGISDLTNFNSVLPLPSNIMYTWITSNYLNLGTDIVVDLSRQWLYENGQPSPINITDTLLTNKRHDLETPDYRTIIRGLDEPDSIYNAYPVSTDNIFAGFITIQNDGGNTDADLFKINLAESGNLSIIISGLNAGLNEISLLSNAGNILNTKSISGNVDSINYFSTSGDYFIKILGLGIQNANYNSYKFSVNYTAPVSANITFIPEAFLNNKTNTLNMKDTATVYLRNSTSPYSIIDSAKGIMDSVNFKGEFEFKNTPDGTYYIVVNHRNSIETWSKTGGEAYTVGQILNFDFTNSSAKAFGSNLILNGEKYCIYSGDADQDGFVNLNDVIIVYNDANDFLTGYLDSDINGDNITDLNDLIFTYNNSTAFVKKISP